MKDNTVSFALIGCGYWGPNFLRNLVAHKKCKVEAVVDISCERRDFVTELYPDVTVVSDVQRVFSDKSINAVVIATPVATHFDLAIKALEAGKHVLVEKPMAKTALQVEQIDAAAKKKNLVAMAGHTFVFNPAVRFLKHLIDSGELGELRYIYSKRLNLGRIRSDVDALWNFAPHDISIIQYLLGGLMPVSVAKRGMDYIQKGIDDVVFLNLVYPNKIMVNIHVSWLDPCKVRCMTVVGSKKMAIYDDLADQKIAIYDKGIDHMAVLGENMDFDNPGIFKFNLRSGDVLLPKIDFVEPLKIEIDHFVDCIQKGTKCLTGPNHAMEVVKILNS